jgi:hypothetical protein
VELVQVDPVDPVEPQPGQPGRGQIAADVDHAGGSCRHRCRLATYAGRRLPDHRDGLLVLHPSSPRNAVSLTAETGVCCMFPRRYIL